MRFRALTLSTLLLAALTAATSVLTGCGSSTTIKHSWRSPDWQGEVHHVVVFGMFERAGVRRDFETQMAESLAGAGIRGSASHVLFPSAAELTNEQIKATLISEGIDSVLVARLVSIDKEERYVQGSPYAVAGGSPVGLYNHYHSTYGAVYAPGYTVSYDVVNIETNLYAVEGAQLAWSGISETFDPDDAADAITSYTSFMITTLQGEGFLPAPVASE